MSTDHEIPSFDSVNRQLQIEVFGAERMAQDQFADPELVNQLQRAISTLLLDEQTVGNQRVAGRELPRRYGPSLELYFLAEPQIRGVEIDELTNALMHSPYRIKNVVFGQIHKKRGRLAQVVGLEGPMQAVAKEDILIDLENKPWVVRTIVDTKTKEKQWAAKPATDVDIDQALETLAATAFEEELKAL